MRAISVLGSGGWITRRRAPAVLALAVVLAASLVPVVQFAGLLASGGGVYAPSSPPDYSAALQAFTQLGARIVVVGPKYFVDCLLYTSPSPRDRTRSRMPSSA